MSKVYNDFYFIANSFSSFLQNSSPFLPKTCLNILPDILTAMLSSSSCVTKNISLHCKGPKFDFIQPDSVSRRIRRFFNNEHYNPYLLYDSIINHVISKFSCKHSDNTLHIVFDHMFKSEQFTVFMLSLRIGKKSIPLYLKINLTITSSFLLIDGLALLLFYLLFIPSVILMSFVLNLLIMFGITTLKKGMLLKIKSISYFIISIKLLIMRIFLFLTIDLLLMSSSLLLSLFLFLIKPLMVKLNLGFFLPMLILDGPLNGTAIALVPSSSYSKTKSLMVLT